MENLLDQNKIEKIKEISEQYGLDLVILFGSQASGRVCEDSDIDLAVYRKSGLSFDDKLNLSGEFSKIFRTDKIDVVVISLKSPLLAYNILKKGKIIYTRGNGVFDILRLYSWKLLAESKSFRDRSFAVLKRRIMVNI